MEVQKQFQVRSFFLESVRVFFKDRNFLEVSTPILVKSPGTEANLNYFESSWTSINGSQQKKYLRSSPEIHLKKLLSEGLEFIYEISHCFRNKGEFGPWHHPEFTLLEWYHSNISYEDFMEETLQLIRYLQVNLSIKFPEFLVFPLDKITKLSVFEAFEIYSGISLVDQDRLLAKKGIEKGIISIRPDDDFETAFFKIMLEKIEPEFKKLGCVFLYDYPESQAALAKVFKGVAKRFELYLNGIEICNAFEELTSVEENKNRILDSNKKRREQKQPEIPIDQTFLQALEKGMAPCCGNALGIERLLAVLLGLNSLEPLIPFRKSFSEGLGNQFS